MHPEFLIEVVGDAETEPYRGVGQDVNIVVSDL